MGLSKLNNSNKLTKPNKLKFSVGGNLAKSLLKIAKQAVEEKVFKPVIKEYGSNTEMFTDFLKQAEEQGITPDRSSKLYKQIVDELPGAKEYYNKKTVKSLEEFSDPDEYYKVIRGKEALQDILDSKLVRTNSKTKNVNKDENIVDLSSRPTLWPSFAKSQVPTQYAQGDPDHYIISTKDPSIKVSTQGRHGKGSTYFPTDESGKPLTAIEAEKVDIYKHVNGTYEPVLLTPDEQLADGLYLSTKTEQAQKGLKDSKVKDLVYHGSPNKNINTFKLSQKARFGPGIYTSPKKELASPFAISDDDVGQTYPLLMSAKNPLLEDNPFRSDINKDKNYYEKLNELRQTQGSSLGYPNTEKVEIVARNPSQVKSLFREHLGKWDWDNPNIHKALIPLGIGVAGLGATEMKKGNKLNTRRLKSK